MYNLKISNFQSIAEQEFNFKGFVCLVGASNLGKSGVRRAIGSVLFNDWDASYLRKDTKSTSVELSYGETTVKMIKSDSDNKFILTRNGETTEFNKPGRSIPPEILALGFQPINLDDEALNLTVTEQTDPLFIISYKDATNTKIFNRLFNISRIENAQSKVASDLRANKKELNSALDEYNQTLSEEDNLKKELEEVEAKIKLLEELTQKHDSISQFNILCMDNDTLSMQLAENQADILQAQLDELENLSLVQIYLMKLNEKLDCSSGLGKQTRFLYLNEKIPDQLELVTKFINLDAEEVQADINFTKATVLQSSLETTKSLLDYMSAKLQLEELAIEQYAITSLLDTEETLDRFKSVYTYLFRTKQVQAIVFEDTSAMESQLSDLINVQSLGQYLVKKANINETVTSVSELTTSIEEMNIELNSITCPTCGQALNHQH